MTNKLLIAALATIAAASPASASYVVIVGAPPGTPVTQYCLEVEPITGSRIETVQCKTRAEWGWMGIDVDREWAENGVRVIG